MNAERRKIRDEAIKKIDDALAGLEEMRTTPIAVYSRMAFYSRLCAG